MASGTGTDFLMDAEEEANGPEHRAALIRSSSLATVEKRHRVLNLRRNGFTYDAISKALANGEDGKEPLELSPGYVGRLIADYVAELAESDAETAEVLRTIDNERLERMFQRLELDARRDDPKVRERAISAQLKILDRHAKLNGLDAPTQIEGRLSVNVHAVGHAEHVKQVESEFAKRTGATIDLPGLAHRELPSGERD